MPKEIEKRFINKYQLLQPSLYQQPIKIISYHSILYRQAQKLTKDKLS